MDDIQNLVSHLFEPSQMADEPVEVYSIVAEWNGERYGRITYSNSRLIGTGTLYSVQAGFSAPIQLEIRAPLSSMEQSVCKAGKTAAVTLKHAGRLAGAAAFTIGKSVFAKYARLPPIYMKGKSYPGEVGGWHKDMEQLKKENYELDKQYKKIWSAKLNGFDRVANTGLDVFLFCRGSSRGVKLGFATPKSASKVFHKLEEKIAEET